MDINNKNINKSLQKTPTLAKYWAKRTHNLLKPGGASSISQQKNHTWIIVFSN